MATFTLCFCSTRLDGARINDGHASLDSSKITELRNCSQERTKALVLPLTSFSSLQTTASGGRGARGNSNVASFIAPSLDDQFGTFVFNDAKPSAKP